MARLLYYLSARPPLPDLSEGLCVGSETADDWHADMHRDLPSREKARVICQQCPVINECREYALSDPAVLGTWGGLTEAERWHIRRSRSTSRAVHAAMERKVLTA
jgi:WhiB family transcriptional regulator, redox-sensing transcriptional regulator